MTQLESFQQFVATLPVASSHIHHQPDEVHHNLDLGRLLNTSYSGWSGLDGTSKEGRIAYIEQMGANSYFVWLSRAVARIYGQGEITPANWDAISAAIHTAHRDHDHHVRLLAETCRMKFGVQDAYWNPGDVMGHPQLLRPAYRINAWVMCHSPQTVDHNQNSPWKQPDFQPASIEEYLERCSGVIEQAVASGAVALKSALAYERPLAFDNPDMDLARRAFKASPERVSDAEKLAFGDVVQHHICREAARLGVPLQVHTGLGKLSGSHPMLLEPVIADHPKNLFDLFHCGYPWTDVIGGLLHNYPNVYADFCWLPIISTTAAVRALHEYLDVAFNAERLLWGDDTATSEEAYGARLAWEHVISRVLYERVRDGLLTYDSAEILANRLMYGNVERLYGST